MCQPIINVLTQAVVCTIHMLVRVFMTILLMIENLIRMILQTLYNFISCILQTLSLIPICLVFLLTSKLKCCLCGGGCACSAGRSGMSDCFMSALVILVVFLIFRATGVLDKILGCAKPTSLSSPPPTHNTTINNSILLLAAELAKRINDAKTATKRSGIDDGFLPDDINNDVLRNLAGEGNKGYFPDDIKNVLRNLIPGETPLPDSINDVLGNPIPVEGKDLRNDNSVDIDVDITRQTNADENNDGKVTDTSSNIESTTFRPKLNTATSNTYLITAVTFNEEVNEDSTSTSYTKSLRNVNEDYETTVVLFGNKLKKNV